MLYTPEVQVEELSRLVLVHPKACCRSGGLSLSFLIHSVYIANRMPDICSNPTACWGLGQLRVPSTHAEGFLPGPAAVFPGFSISGLLALRT